MHWIDSLFPSDVCALCLRPNRARFPWACQACIRRFPLVVGPRCTRCGRPYRGVEPNLCRFCTRSLPPFAWGYHMTVFEGHVQSHLHKLKFEHRRAIARPLGSLLGRHLKRRRVVKRNAVVVPVPLHARRLRERGFNQSELLARAVADVLRRPLMSRALVRTKETLSQARLGVEDRVANVRGAFLVPDPSLIRGRSVVLIDDVFTTGATCRAAATALMRAGAATVGVACVAVAASDLDFSPFHLNSTDAAQ